MPVVVGVAVVVVCSASTIKAFVVDAARYTLSRLGRLASQ